MKVHDADFRKKTRGSVRAHPVSDQKSLDAADLTHTVEKPLRKGSHDFGVFTKKKQAKAPKKRKRKEKRGSTESSGSNQPGLPEFGNAWKILNTKYADVIHIVEDLIVEGLTFLPYADASTGLQS
jgi:hypothetical protein